ncbi:MAG TPA: alpha/beta fold hydrolase [Frankiaceae bacterium]|nr:alpha/beta fold hydrolase [Frankiaceae bacterium]
MAPRRRRGAIAAAGALAATAAGVAGVAVSRSPVLRKQAGMAVGFVRGVDHPPSAPVPPTMLPGRIVLLPERGEVFVRDSGPREGPDTPTLLLLHGWTVGADLNFFTIYEQLARSYRVIALDHRGHGRGMRSTELFSLEDCADDAAALLGVLGVAPGRTIALGYSMGGPIALLLARRHPGLISALVSQATALEWRATLADRSKWRFLSVAEVGLRVSSGDGVVERVIDQAVKASPHLEPIRPWLEAEIQRGLGRSLIDAGRALSLFDSRPWAKELRIPAVVCVTTQDRLVLPAKQRALARALRAEVLEIAGDHDVTLVDGATYAAVTQVAVDRAAGLLSAPSRSRHKARG